MSSLRMVPFQRHWRVLHAVALVALLAALLLGAPAPARGEPVFSLGVVNQRGGRPGLALERFGALRAWLDARLRERGMAGARLIVAGSLAEVAQRIAAAEVDALSEGVMPTFQAVAEGAPLEPELVVTRMGQREYFTVFFARRDASVHGLADLAGRTIALESPRSTSAFFVPLASLLEAGLAVRPGAVEEGGPATDERPVVRYLLAGTELNQAYWVLRGKADAGAFNDGDWDRIPPVLRDQLAVFARSPPLVRWLISFRKGLAPALREAVTSALLDAHEDEAGRAALARAAGAARVERLDAGDRRSLESWRPAFERVRRELP